MYDPSEWASVGLDPWRGATMRLTGSYPVLLMEDSRAAGGFFVAHLGFATS